MTTATLHSAARKELDSFQHQYGHIVSEYIRCGRRNLLQKDHTPNITQTEKIVKCYFEKVETYSKLTRLMSQEYLSAVNIEVHRPQYVPKKWQPA